LNYLFTFILVPEVKKKLSEKK